MEDEISLLLPAGRSDIAPFGPHTIPSFIGQGLKKRPSDPPRTFSTPNTPTNEKSNQINGLDPNQSEGDGDGGGGGNVSTIEVIICENGLPVIYNFLIET